MGRKPFDVWEAVWWAEDYLTGIELLDDHG